MEEEKETPEENVVHVVEVESNPNKKQIDNVVIQDGVVRLTPTGKVSHAKTRVYTQRYRKEWEHMDDFKDWLTSVPFEATRAYCKFCQRNLHAHRLSLLKHMCTLKHQRAAVQYEKRKNFPIKLTEKSDTTDENDFAGLEFDEEDYEDALEDDGGVEEEMEEVLEDEMDTSATEEVENKNEQSLLKNRITKKEVHEDPLARAIADSDFLTAADSDDQIQLEMVVESEHDNDNEGSYQIIKYNNLSDSTDQSGVQNDDRKKGSQIAIQKVFSVNNPKNQVIKSEPKNAQTHGIIDSASKVILLSSSGKPYTLIKTNAPNTPKNQLQNKNVSILIKSDKNNSQSTNTASNSEVSTNKSVANASPPVITRRLPQPIISTHVLETSKGVAVAGLQVSLYKLQDGRWTFMQESMTADNGECNDLLHAKINVTLGRYKLHYDVEKYYSARKISTIYPFIEIVFDVRDPNAVYHIPLLLTPHSYSTYKDARR